MDKKSNLNKFVTFLENDIYRSLKVMGPIIILFFLGHIGSIIYSTNSFNKLIASELKKNKGLSRAEILNPISNTTMSRIFGNSDICMIIFISFGLIILYALILWNREWSGSSKSIYTTLSLPFKRVNILISKICTIFIFLGVNLTLQIAALFIDDVLVKHMVAKDLLNGTSLISYFRRGYMTGGGFGKMYSQYLVFEPMVLMSDIILALSLILLLGLIILLFRSFKFKGGILGVIILALFLTIYGFTSSYFKFYLFEKMWFNILFPLGISILSFIWSKYLLDNKVGV